MGGFLLERLAIFLYILSTAGFVVHVLRRNRVAGRYANLLLLIGFGLQTLAWAIRAASLGQLPVFTLASSLGFFGWALAGAYLLAWWRFRVTALGAFAAPLAMILVLVSSVIQGETNSIGPIFRSVWLTIHLGTIFAGYACFGLAFVAGIMYLLQEREIKSRKHGAMFHRLPSLNVLDSVNHHCLVFGFPLMTLGLATGMINARMTLGTYWQWDPKEVWSLILWLFYAVQIHQRLTVGWRGRRAAVLAIIGFSVLCFTFFGVNLIMPGYHSFENLRQLQLQ